VKQMSGRAWHRKPRRVECMNELTMGSTNEVVKGPLREMLWSGQDRGV
jgi:hypothetical protein